MLDYKQKIKNYQNALARLQEGALRLGDSDDLLRDGLIQRFEFTFDLAWKTLKAIFEDEGLVGLNSPKTVLREAYAAGIITDEEMWLAMLSDRNSTAHIYSEQKAIEICNHIVTSYTNELANLLQQIKKRMID